MISNIVFTPLFTELELSDKALSNNSSAKSSSYEEYLSSKNDLIGQLNNLTDDDSKSVKKRRELCKLIDDLWESLPKKEKEKSESYIYFSKKKKPE